MMNNYYISLSEFENELSKHDEVISVKRAVIPYGNPQMETGLEVLIRSKIKYYDREALDMVLQSGRYKDAEDILSGIPDLHIEHRYFVRTDWAYRVPHTSTEAFCDGALAIGGFEHPMRSGYMDHNASVVVEAMIQETHAFNVLDWYYVTSLINWANEIRKGVPV